MIVGTHVADSLARDVGLKSSNLKLAEALAGMRDSFAVLPD